MERNEEVYLTIGELEDGIATKSITPRAIDEAEALGVDIADEIRALHKEYDELPGRIDELENLLADLDLAVDSAKEEFAFDNLPDRFP